jgi:hypothetical protein
VFTEADVRPLNPEGAEAVRGRSTVRAPSGKLAAGPSSATVQVTETMTNLNGKRKVKTKTTAQATIPLTIN